MTRTLLAAATASLLIAIGATSASAGNGLCNDPFDCNGPDDSAPAQVHHAHRKAKAKKAPPLTMAAARRAARRLPYTYYNLSCSRLGPRRVSCGYSYPEEADYDGRGYSRTGRVCHNSVIVFLPHGVKQPIVSSAEGVQCEEGTWLE